MMHIAALGSVFRAALKKWKKVEIHRLRCGSRPDVEERGWGVHRGVHTIGQLTLPQICAIAGPMNTQIVLVVLVLV